MNTPVIAQSETSNETEPNNSSDYTAFGVFVFIVIIVGIILWNLTHRTKKRKGLSSRRQKGSVKGSKLQVRHLQKKVQEYGTMTI